MATTMTLETVANSGDGEKDNLLVTIDWESTAGGASTTSTADFDYMFRPISDYLQGRKLSIGQTVPGAVTPDAYDVTVSDDNGQDLFGGSLSGRSTTDTESSYGYDTITYGERPISGDLSIAVLNAGNAKTGKLVLTFE